MTAPVQVIVAAFSDPKSAGTVLNDLKQGRKDGLIGILDAAVVVKDADSKVKITDAKKRTAKGFATGGVIGALVGLLAAPPVGAAAVGGGVIGALVGKLRNAPIKSELKTIASALPPGSSAIVAEIEHDWVPQLQAELAAEGAQLVQDTIQADIAEQLNAGGNILYTAGGGALGSGVARVVDSAAGTQFSSVVVGENGAIVDNAVITDEPVEEIAAR